MDVLHPARLAFAEDGTPYSTTFGDVYHSAHGGPQQARHVFIGGNGLPGRWQRRERFVILETGFGLGLNFLATWQQWQNDPERCQRLHFISVEKFPFTAQDMAMAHQAWPEFSALSRELIRHWPTLTPGIHRLHLADGRVVLDLVFGDAVDLLPQLELAADAFYLDGFSPARNPELWSPALLQNLAELAAPGATLATWSVAGHVRQALGDTGWQIEKAKGFAGKRQMLRGTRPDAPRADPAVVRHAIVLGAGLAGSSAAQTLVARGWQVTLIDAANGPGEGASGNRAGVLRPLPSRDDNALARITRAGFLATSRHLQALDAAGLAELIGPLWDRTGVLHLARDDLHEATQRQVVIDQHPPADFLQYVDREAAALHCGRPVSQGGWWFPGGAWVSPANYCRANLLAAAQGIRTLFKTRVEHIRHQPHAGWQVRDASGIVLAEAPHLVIANASDARRLLGDWLPIHPARGQVSHLPADAGSAPLCVVCRLGYVTPAIGGERYAGATFMMRDDDPAVREADHRENLAKLNFMLPGYTTNLDATPLTGRVGIRPTSPDRLPAIGPIRQLHDDAAPPGLWLVNGFGARGIVWSALAGEMIADQIENTPRLLDRTLTQVLDPHRFLNRKPRPAKSR